MATFSYADIERLYTDYSNVFKSITTYLRTTHSVAFQGARKNGERQFERYLRAFNKHSKDISKTFGKVLEDALSGAKTPSKPTGKVGEWSLECRPNDIVCRCQDMCSGEGYHRRPSSSIGEWENFRNTVC